MAFDPTVLPPDLPVPADDGAARHLPGLRMPDIALASTAGGEVNLSLVPGLAVVYCYPRTGRPGEDMPAGWDAIPGARGCTPESCGFRDHNEELGRLGAKVFGLSTQEPAYQRELVERLRLPFQRPGPGSHQAAGPAHFRDRRDDLDQAAEPSAARWPHRPCLLPGLSARPPR